MIDGQKESFNIIKIKSMINIQGQRIHLNLKMYYFNITVLSFLGENIIIVIHHLPHHHRIVLFDDIILNRRSIGLSSVEYI